MTEAESALGIRRDGREVAITDLAIRPQSDLPPASGRPWSSTTLPASAIPSSRIISAFLALSIKSLGLG